MLLLLILILSPVLCFANCPTAFQNKCRCGRTRWQPNSQTKDSEKYVVNCTNTHFSNSDPLKSLPEETEVLIFTGNFLNELPVNIFGVGDHDKLNYIDMSHNRISFIKGKTFHKVNYVETLILNYNDISITGKHNRPRMFSNFENLKNLHLTDAFTDSYNASTYYLLSLEDIFDESELEVLQKLHLEQNEIQTIGTKDSIFCTLFEIQHLYLADNKLSDMDFQIDCLDKLNYIDLRFNTINRLSDDAIKRLEDFSKTHKKTLRINMKDNPFDCDCRAKKFLHWLKTTEVSLHETDKYICQDGYPPQNINLRLLEVKNASCPGSNGGSIVVKKEIVDGYSSGTVAFLSFIIVVLIISGIFLVHYHKKRISMLMQPILDEFTRKMGYSGLAKDETLAPAAV